MKFTTTSDAIFLPGKYFPQCHASTVISLPNGNMLAAWFGGTRESAADTAIWCSVLDKEWNPPRQVFKINEIPHWNPVLFVDSEGKVHLFFKVGEHPWQWETYHSQTDSLVAAWSTPKRQYRREWGPVRNKVLQLSNGVILAPSSTETITSQADMNGRPLFVWDAFIDRSTDNGKVWHKCPNIVFDRKKFGDYGGIIQPALWESTPGHVHAFFRSTHSRLFRSDSADYGLTWSPAEATEIPNNNSAVDVVLFKDKLVMICNPVAGNWVARTPISLLVGDKEGRNFEETRHDIEGGPGSFAYPSMIQFGDKLAYTYTWNRTTIKFGLASLET